MEATWGVGPDVDFRGTGGPDKHKSVESRFRSRSSSNIVLVLSPVIIMADKITRIAIVDDNRCKPKRCAQECKKVRVPAPLPI